MDQSQISTEKPAFGRHKFELHERSLLGICSQSSLGGSSLRNGSAHGAVLRLPAQKFQNVIVSCVQRRGGHGEGGVPIGQRTTSHVGLTASSCARYAGAAALGGKSAANAEPATCMIAATATDAPS